MRTIGNSRIRRTAEGISYGSGTTIKQLCDWDLAGNDDAATVEAAGFFNALSKDMQVGELVRCRLNLAAAPVYKVYMVTANAAGVVTVAKQTVT